MQKLKIILCLSLFWLGAQTPLHANADQGGNLVLKGFHDPNVSLDIKLAISSLIASLRGIDVSTLPGSTVKFEGMENHVIPEPEFKYTGFIPTSVNISSYKVTGQSPFRVETSGTIGFQDYAMRKTTVFFEMAYHVTDKNLIFTRIGTATLSSASPQVVYYFIPEDKLPSPDILELTLAHILQMANLNTVELGKNDTGDHPQSYMVLAFVLDRLNDDDKTVFIVEQEGQKAKVLNMRDYGGWRLGFWQGKFSLKDIGQTITFGLGMQPGKSFAKKDRKWVRFPTTKSFPFRPTPAN